MKTGESGYNLIKSFESLRLDAYLDPIGIPTIGYGTISIDGQPVQMGTTITEDQADYYLQLEAEGFEKTVNQHVTVELTQNQFDALICFTYNLGSGSLLKSTLLKKLNQGDYQGASEEFEKWNMAGGHPLAGLTRRRLAERDLFLQ